YPPAAHSSPESSDTPVLATQPSAAAKMSVSLDARRQETKAERMRGGCIPCPVS
ncbi:hypothetical protein BV25DRAFT_1784039, partial [Artomyces pyxidatus]